MCSRTIVKVIDFKCGLCVGFGCVGLIVLDAHMLQRNLPKEMNKDELN